MKPQKPPQFPPGEKAILGGILVDPDCVARVAAEIRPEHFHGPRNRAIYSAILSLHRDGEPIDWVTLNDRLLRDGAFEKAGGAEYLAELAEAVPTAGNIMHYVSIVKEKAALRRIRSLALKAYRETAEERSPNEIIKDLEQGCFDLTREAAPSGPVLITELNRSCHAAYSERLAAGAAAGIPTGFTKLDGLIGGLRPAELTIVCGRPSMGKTAFALDVMLNVADRRWVLFFSLEMGAADLWDRLISKMSGVSLHGIRAGYLTPVDRSRIEQARARLDRLKLIIDDSPALTATDIRLRAQSAAIRHGITPELIVIDYLQRMRPEHRDGSRDEQVGNTCRVVKDSSKLLHCPILLISSLNRKPEDRRITDQLPRMSDLRESGAIEFEVDVAVGLFRRGQVEADRAEFRNHARVGVFKNRNGPVGRFELFFEPATASFRNLSQRDDEPERGRHETDDDRAMEGI